MNRVSFLFLALILAPCLTTAQGPLVLTGDGKTPVKLTRLPAVLNHPTIHEELHSGLTNTLLLLITVNPEDGQKRRGGATIDIRYELWDEVFLITVTDLNKRSYNEKIASHSELLSWWRNLKLDVLGPESLASSQGLVVEVELRLLPFSQAEQNDAQLWLTSSHASEGSTVLDNDPIIARTGRVTNDRLLDVLVATSIKRRPILSFSWTAAITAERDGENEQDG